MAERGGECLAALNAAIENKDTTIVSLNGDLSVNQNTIISLQNSESKWKTLAALGGVGAGVGFVMAGYFRITRKDD